MKLLAPVLFLALGSLQAQDPLPSWNDTAPKKAIVAFVQKVTKDGSPDFVSPDDRIATFDNDGTLWAEQPIYFQFLFAIDRVKALAPQHPEWKTKEPFASFLRGDMKVALAGGEKGLLEMMAATHTGMTVEEFTQIVNNWITTARHPKTGRLYTEMAYQAHPPRSTVLSDAPSGLARSLPTPRSWARAILILARVGSTTSTSAIASRVTGSTLARA